MRGTRTAVLADRGDLHEAVGGGSVRLESGEPGRTSFVKAVPALRPVETAELRLG